MVYPILLLCLSFTLFAADQFQYSKLTLKDGRTLIGDFDPNTGVLLINGNASMRISIEKDKIASIEPTERPKAQPTKREEEAGKPDGVNRQSVDQQASAYAKGVAAYYTDVIHRAKPPPEQPKPNDTMTVKQIRDIDQANRERESLEQAKNMLGALLKQLEKEPPAIQALRAAQFEHSILYASDGDTRRKVLGIPEPAKK